MNNEYIQVGSCSIIGDRAYQQDAMEYKKEENRLLAVVCDGMGGLQGGERASQEAIRLIFDSFEQLKYKVRDTEKYYQLWMNNTFIDADKLVANLRNENGDILGAGTTVVAAVAEENKIYWGSVGDSGIYLMKANGSLKMVNRMHNYNLRLDEMISQNLLTPEEAEKKRGNGEALISFLGIKDISLIDIGNKPIIMETGDILLLTSDGVYKSLDLQQMQVIVEESGGNMNLAAERLCYEAWRLSKRKQDNTTAIALKYLGSKED